MKRVMNLFKIFSRDVDKPASSDVYPKYRVVKTYDGYKVQTTSESEEQWQRYKHSAPWGVGASRWVDLGWDGTHMFKLLAILSAKLHIRRDRRERERKVYETRSVWGPEP
jgi:hypothetical protein